MPDALNVTVVYSPAPREMREWAVQVPAGCTVADAISASPLRAEFPALDLEALGVGVWGRSAQPDELLRDRDRIEVYRPLRIDPKVARRERFRRQGSRAAGLFAKKK